MKLCLVASAGGHLLQMVQLRPFWGAHSRFWVTFDKDDAKSLLEEERVLFAFHPTNRNLINFFRNLILAWSVLGRERPDMVLSTGAGVAVPFLLVGRVLGMKTVYVESVTRIRDLSLSGKLIYHFVHLFFVQWAELAARYPKSVYGGRVF